tara:strand:+ start:373 stop:621 length:249 start_codon:yes stop_codon:yes gene_type:complete
MSENIKQLVRELAKDATPLSDDDDGSERQVEAAWKLWDFMVEHCTQKETDDLERESVSCKWSQGEAAEECVKLIDKKFKEDE